MDQESVHVGISWAGANLQRLGPWLLPRERVEDLQPCVVAPSFNLSVIFSALAETKRGTSASLPVAVRPAAAAQPAPAPAPVAP